MPHDHEIVHLYDCTYTLYIYTPSVAIAKQNSRSHCHHPMNVSVWIFLAWMREFGYIMGMVWVSASKCSTKSWRNCIEIGYNFFVTKWENSEKSIENAFCTAVKDHWENFQPFTGQFSRSVETLTPSGSVPWPLPHSRKFAISNIWRTRH